MRVFSNRCVIRGTSLTGLPVLLAEHTAVGLKNIQSQVENHAVFSLSHTQRRYTHYAVSNILVKNQAYVFSCDGLNKLILLTFDFSVTTFTLPLMIDVACSFTQFDYIVESVFAHDSNVSKSKQLTLLTTLTSLLFIRRVGLKNLVLIVCTYQKYK